MRTFFGEGGGQHSQCEMSPVEISKQMMATVPWVMAHEGHIYTEGQLVITDI